MFSCQTKGQLLPWLQGEHPQSALFRLRGVSGIILLGEASIPHYLSPGAKLISDFSISQSEVVPIFSREMCVKKFLVERQRHVNS